MSLLTVTTARSAEYLFGSDENHILTLRYVEIQSHMLLPQTVTKKAINA